MKIYEKIDRLCNMYNINDDLKEEITRLCKESYIKGSNDCHATLKEFNMINK